MEEIRNLVRQERNGQDKLRKAHEKADGLIAKSKEKARAIIAEVENPEYFGELYKKKSEEIAGDKEIIEKEAEKKIEHIYERTDALAVKKAATLIVKYVLEK